MAEVVFTDAALDDLRRLGPEVVPRVLRKVLLLVDEPEAGQLLGGELTGFRKLVVGRNTWRIVYWVTLDKVVEICEVWAVGARADAEVYREATARLRTLSARTPDLAALVEVVDRLGRLAGELTVEVAPRPEPVPDWLAERLVHTVGMPRERVAALSLREAVDTWTAQLSGPADRSS